MPLESPERDVLDDDPARSKLIDDASKLTPQARALSSKARALSRAGEILAREAAADEIHGSESCSADRTYVIESLRLRPVLGEHGSAERFFLDLPERWSEPSPLEPKLEAAYPSK